MTKPTDHFREGPLSAELERSDRGEVGLLRPRSEGDVATHDNDLYVSLTSPPVTPGATAAAADADAGCSAVGVVPLHEDVARLIAAGLPENTRLAYAGDRRAWEVFCQLQGAPRLPPSGELLAAWAAQMLMVGNVATDHPRPLATSTVERRLSAVATMAVEHGYPRPDLRLAGLVLRGYRRHVGGDRPAKAAPMTVDVLTALLERARAPREVDGSLSLRALRDSAVLVLGFAVGARRSELVSLDIDDISLSTQGMSVRVLRAKTRSRADTVAVPFGRDPQLCPVRASVAYIEALQHRGVHHGPLFRRITRTDVVLTARLRPAFVADLVAALADRAGIAVPQGFRGWSAHSMRRGLAVELRRAGADPLTVARQGGWSDNSAAVAGYLSEVDRWAGHPLRQVL